MITKKRKKTLKDLLGSFESWNTELQKYIDSQFPLYCEPGELWIAIGDFFLWETPIDADLSDVTRTKGEPWIQTVGSGVIYPKTSGQKAKANIGKRGTLRSIKTKTPVMYLGFELYEDLDYVGWWLIGEKTFRGLIQKRNLMEIKEWHHQGRQRANRTGE